MSVHTNTGKSTHPYDTGVGNKDSKSVTNDTQLKSVSHIVKGAGPSRGHTPRAPQTPNQFGKNKGTNSSSSLRSKIIAPALRKRNKSTCMPGPQANRECAKDHRIGFRSILRLNRSKGKESNSNPEEDVRTSPGQVSTEAESQAEETRRESWWSFKRRTSAYNGGRDAMSVPGEMAMSQNEEDGSNSKATINAQRMRNNGTSGCRNGYLLDRMTKKPFENKARYGTTKRGPSTKPEGSANQVQKGDDETEKTEKSGLSPRTNTELTKIPRSSKRRRRSISSSQVHASTAGTNSTPGTTATPKDTGREEWRHRSPSPMIPAQVLRLLLGPGKSPSPKMGTQPDPEDTELGASVSTVMLGRQSRDGHASGRQSTEQKNRAWIPFWGSPRSQAGLSRRDNADGESTCGDVPEPTTENQGQNVWAGQKKGLDRISRRRWRSG
ncbi:hypothetical protein F5Y11DRAFT_125762 [Daldinia sp. FL1419]|nr:hypothetical protein F5Y11DRAFT_125762 [Daldinia sp. FL1419]